jgi:hypothetical protein
MLQEGYEDILCDGHYALVHLYEDYPEYFQHTIKTLQAGRPVILDNSIFELETAFDANRFVGWINEIRKYVDDEILDGLFTYIIPDVLDDAEGTLSSVKSFLEAYPDLPGKSMGVAQGKTLGELCECFDELQNTYRLDKIGISFNCKAYEHLYRDMSVPVLEKWMRGRQEFIQLLAMSPRVTVRDVHLLGCSLPQEFVAYQEIPGIVSIDTSNPIIHGLLDIPYAEQGLLIKERIKLVDLFSTVPSQHQLNLITYNCSEFRRLARG